MRNACDSDSRADLACDASARDAKSLAMRVERREPLSLEDKKGNSERKMKITGDRDRDNREKKREREREEKKHVKKHKRTSIDLINRKQPTKTKQGHKEGKRQMETGITSDASKK